MTKKIRKEKEKIPSWEKKTIKDSYYSSLIVGIAFFVCSMVMFFFKLHPYGYNERFGQFSVSSPYFFLFFSIVLFIISYYLYKKHKNDE